MVDPALKTWRTPPSLQPPVLFLPLSQLLLSETGLNIESQQSCLAGPMLWIRVLASLTAAGANVARPHATRQLEREEKRTAKEAPPAHRGRDIPPVRGRCHPVPSCSKFKFVSSLRSGGGGGVIAWRGGVGRVSVVR